MKMKDLFPLPKPHRRRQLTDEEIDLWIKVTEAVAPLPGAHKPDRSLPLAPPEPQPRPVTAGFEPAAPPAAPVRRLPPLAPLERRLKQKLLRRRIEVDALIDLHGLRQQEAESALRRFLHRAQAEDARLVLVITGKGGRAAESDGLREETGVLRRAVPHWLRAPDLRAIVTGFDEAGPAHGGAGALYVKIRRRDRRGGS
jgi:DNA-nicking Smr family endonuclease